METTVTVTQLLPMVRDLGRDALPIEQADAAGLRYVTDGSPGCRRIRRGRGFSYHRPDGSLIDGDERERLEGLAVPPAWADVWICPDPRGHLQATGRDDAGRKQYLYHPVWRQLREAAKFHRLVEFGDALPRIRRSVDVDLRRRAVGLERVVAIVVALLDETHIRIGNEENAEGDGAQGLTTLRAEHVEVSATKIAFDFEGKSGRQRSLEVRNRRLARQLRRIGSAPGERLFGSRDSDGASRHVDADTVNAYLRQVADADVTAKDFRTWGGTVTAAERLRALGPARGDPEIDGYILDAVDAAAERLGNTRAVARASYVHPWVTKAYRMGRLLDQWDDRAGAVDALDPAERAVRRVLRLDLPPSKDPEEALAIQPANTPPA